jgi:hypothetical protein
MSAGSNTMNPAQPDRTKERTVVIFSGSNLFEIEAIAQEIEAAGISCHIDGRDLAGTFAGLNTLDGVTLMRLVVLESDAPKAREIADEWLQAAKDDTVDDAEAEGTGEDE